MEISTKEISKDLKEKIEASLMPLAEDLKRLGYGKRRIEGVLMNHIKMETAHYYQQRKGPQTIGNIVGELLLSMSADSKAEMRMFEALMRAGIKFDFQYPIGPYRADFFVPESLVVELDGPHHKNQTEKDSKRDAYMEALGYKVLRIPLHYLALDEVAVMDSIKALSKGGTS